MECRWEQVEDHLVEKCALEKEKKNLLDLKNGHQVPAGACWNNFFGRIIFRSSLFFLNVESVDISYGL